MDGRRRTLLGGKIEVTVAGYRNTCASATADAKKEEIRTYERKRTGNLCRGNRLEKG